MTTSNVAGVTTSVVASPITLRRIFRSDYQKEGTMTAELEQQIKTVKSYPAKKTETSMQANFFTTEEFGFESKVFDSVEKRIAWLTVPVTATEAILNTKLVTANAAKAVVYRVLSNHPILDENQQYAINSGIRTKDHFANKQAVRYPENTETIANGTANKLILKDGRVQYRRTFLWKTPMADIDKRTTAPEDTYMTPEIAAELSGASVMQGQTL